jgi:hypothetical protein
MILSAILNIVATFINGLAALLPTASLPTGVSDTLVTIFLNFNAFVTFFPFMAHLLVIMSLGMTIELSLLTWAFSKWGISLIRG